MGILSTLSGLRIQQPQSADTGLTKDASTATRLNYANTLARSGREGDAATIYWDMIEKDPNEVQAGVNLAHLLLEQGHANDATLVLSVMADKNPNFSPLWCNLSAALSQTGDHDRALLAADRAVIADPDNAMAYYNRGACYWYYLQHRLAIADYERASRLDPSNTEIAQQLALAIFTFAPVMAQYADAKYEPHAHGYEIVDGMEVAATLMCPHCGCHFRSVKGLENPRCMSCGELECGAVECIPCNPYLKQLEDAHKTSNTG